MWLLAAVIVAAIVQSWLLTALAKRVAWRIDFLDRPDNDRKTHEGPTPLLGGVAVYLAVVLAAVEYLALATFWNRSPAMNVGATGLLLLSAGLFCAVGLWDDKWGMRARTKFLLQIAAALPFVLWGRSIEQLEVLGYTCSLGVWGVPVTVLSLVICTNAVNLLDGLDGVAGGVGVVVSLTVAVIALMIGHQGVAVSALLMAAVLVGFLIHNWPPASIFLGDSGSLTIGFLLGALAIEGSIKTATGLTLVLPMVLLSVPGFDTLMAIVRRVLSGRGIGQGDRAHLHHCLKDRGLNGTQVLLAIVSMCLAMGLAVIVSVIVGSQLVALAVCVGMLLLLVTGRVFGYRETALLLKHLEVLSSVPAATTEKVRSTTLLERLKSYPPDRRMHAWSELHQYLQRRQGVSLELVCREEASAEELVHLRWTADRPDGPPPLVWRLSCEVHSPAGAIVRLVSVGEKTPGRARPLNDLMDLMEAFLERWPAPQVEIAAKPAGNLRVFPERPAASESPDERPQPAEVPAVAVARAA